MESVNMIRANKLTAYWAGEGVAQAKFYKTHDVVAELKSDDVQVVTNGFAFPEGEGVTATQKLESYKNWLAGNATIFGLIYDPVDRRADDYKFPNKYDGETFKVWAGKMLVKSLDEVVTKMNGKLDADHQVDYIVGDAEIEITEAYKSGSLKYATALIPVTFSVPGFEVVRSVTVDLVSGQIKKPRQIGDAVMTMTGLKTLLIECGLLPQPEPKEDKKVVSEAITEDAGDIQEYEG